MIMYMDRIYGILGIFFIFVCFRMKQANQTLDMGAKH